MARALIVDDEQDILKTYSLLISGMGHEVFVAKDLEEAKSVILTERDLDIALVDRVLPGEESGLEIKKVVKCVVQIIIFPESLTKHSRIEPELEIGMPLTSATLAASHCVAMGAALVDSCVK